MTGPTSLLMLTADEAERLALPTAAPHGFRWAAVQRCCDQAAMVLVEAEERPAANDNVVILFHKEGPR